MDKKIEVTVGICVKNCEATITNVIKRVINQDFEHHLMEVIFVDDASNDQTLLKIKKYSHKMNMKVKIFQTGGRGLGYARNVVVNNAEGDFIVWVDGDMTLPNDFIRRQVNFMRENVKVGVAKAKYGILPYLNLVGFLENIQFVIGNSKFEPGTGGSIYRVEAIKDAGGFDERLSIAGEDQDLVNRIRKIGWNLSRSPAVFYEIPRKTWKSLWVKYFRWGYGLSTALWKNPELLSLPRMTLFASILFGLTRALKAYRLVLKKRVFLLPFHCLFKMTAWWLGYIYGYIELKKQ